VTKIFKTVSFLWNLSCFQIDSLIGLRIEWCKARSHSERWAEEVTLLREEMRRVVAFFEWEKHQWLQRAPARTFENEVEREGSVAYAKRQAALRSSIVTGFQFLWKTILMSPSEDSEERSMT
jgi:hypothetical protein